MATVIVDNIRKYADEQRLKFYQIEANSGIGNGAIGKWERGIVQPSISSLTRVAETLGCTVADLVKEEE